eukprot:TRINITY_DN5055_c0_g1_i1.p1 TRINITY_DN5055_c0_g1~~TRINITY_DN5055_c0_g1_i1.p1  ORF type:complete len:786 (-),score=180.48 TRINITY_DN5055_c0_g1_i1:68-2425(-)
MEFPLPSTSTTFKLQKDIVSNSKFEKLICWDTVGYTASCISKHMTNIVCPIITIGDGNCLLRALSISIWGGTDYARKLRDLTLRELETHREFYKKSVDKLNENDEPGYNDKEFDEFIKQIRSPKEYLSFIHIFAVSNVIRRPIIVYASDEDMSNFGTHEEGCAGTFLPTRWGASGCVGGPVAVSWSSSKKNHFVPLVMFEGSTLEWPLLSVAYKKTLSNGDSIDDYIKSGIQYERNHESERKGRSGLSSFDEDEIMMQFGTSSSNNRSYRDESSGDDEGDDEDDDDDEDHIDDQMDEKNDTSSSSMRKHRMQSSNHLKNLLKLLIKVMDEKREDDEKLRMRLLDDNIKMLKERQESLMKSLQNNNNNNINNNNNKPNSKSTTESSDNEEMEEKEFDMVLNINLNENVKKPLGYNFDEKPYDAAKRWLIDNNIDLSYLDTIEKFIYKKSLEAQKSPEKYTKKQKLLVKKTKTLEDLIRERMLSNSLSNKFIPFKGPLIKYSSADKIGQIIQKIISNSQEIKQKSQTDISLDDHEKVLFKQLETSILNNNNHNNNNDDKLYISTLEIVDKKLMKWPQDKLFPVIDLTRLLILNDQVVRHLVTNDKLRESIFKSHINVLKSNSVTNNPPSSIFANSFMCLKFVTNLFAHKEVQHHIIQNQLTILKALYDNHKYFTDDDNVSLYKPDQINRILETLSATLLNIIFVWLNDQQEHVSTDGVKIAVELLVKIIKSQTSSSEKLVCMYSLTALGTLCQRVRAKINTSWFDALKSHSDPDVSSCASVCASLTS